MIFIAQQKPFAVEWRLALRAPCAEVCKGTLDVQFWHIVRTDCCASTSPAYSSDQGVLGLGHQELKLAKQQVVVGAMTPIFLLFL
jgi:hypothetical protein